MKKDSRRKPTARWACALCAAALTLGWGCTAPETPDVPYENDLIRVGTSVGNIDGVATRAFADTDHEALKTGSKLRLKVSGKWVGHTPDPEVLYPVGTVQAEDAVNKPRLNQVTFDGANQFYWDNFGTGDPANTEGRTEGLTVYAVGINDGTTAAPNPGTGATDWQNLAWSVEKGGTNVLTRDLVFSNNIKNGISDTRYKYANRTNPIQLDMQHALSMVTVKIVADEGFPETGTGLIGATTHKFEANPAFTLSSNGFGVSGNPEYALTKGTINIETGVITSDATSAATVKAMTTSTSDASYTVIQTALVFPGTLLGRAADADLVGNLEVDGNDYNVSAAKMRAAMLAADASTDYKTKAGYNYIFKIRVKKTGITVEASVEKWKEVSAEEQEGKIWFEGDVASSSVTAPEQKAAITTDGSKFNVYKAAATTAFDSWTLTSPSTVATYNAGDSKWENSPTIYWQNKDDNLYFRALAKTTSASTDAAPATEAYGSNALTQYSDVTTGADDVLWGTSAQHTATLVGTGTQDYAESAVIKPRTSAVPMMFYHAKSKLTIVLTTKGTPESTTDPIVLPDQTKWVDLTGAVVKITNLYTTATLKMSDGTYTYPSAKTAEAIANTSTTVASDKMSATTSLAESMVIPQTIADGSMVEITLGDGTKYKVQLNKCKDSASPNPAITEWKRGTHYKYTFCITKLDIQVSASLAPWTEVTSTQDIWF